MPYLAPKDDNKLTTGVEITWHYQSYKWSRELVKRSTHTVRSVSFYSEIPIKETVCFRFGPRVAGDRSVSPSID